MGFKMSTSEPYVAPLLLFSLLLFLLSSSPCDGHEVLCKPREREALLQFKKGITTDKFGNLSSWVADGGADDCCKWEGIGCNNHTGHVIKLDLSYIGGTYISPSLAYLEHLEHLKLRRCDFGASRIPAFFGSFKSLRYLNLQDANFSGMIPWQLGNLSALETLDLSFISGLESDGEWLFNLSSLRFIDMSHVNLRRAARLFEALSRMPSISLVYLVGCGLDPGSLTSLLHANFTSLSKLDLSWNRMELELPNWLLNVTSLQFLHLGGNSVSRTYKIAGNLCKLQDLDLTFNKIVDTELGTFFMGCDRRRTLSRLSLGQNKITGHLPASLGDYKSLKYLDIWANSLSGSIPESIGGMESLVHLDLSYNRFNGSIPSSLWECKSLNKLLLSGTSLHGTLSEVHLRNLSQLTWLYLSSNSLTIKLSPNWVPPFNLQRLGMASCKVGPRFPLWLRTQSNLKYVNMSNSGISDVMPEWIWNFSPGIQVMDLSMNMIKGVLPAAMNGSKKLEGSLSGSPTARRVGGLSQLLALSLSQNNLTGDIPSFLCEATHLRVLDLSNNHLTGQLPQCLGGLESLTHSCSMKSLHLENNSLQGNLPLWLGSCKDMIVLDIGHNNFSGNMPSWLAGMHDLQFLRLRSNLFGGGVPQKLSSLKFLQFLDLAENHLSGGIPDSFGKFTAMKTKHITGNPFFYSEVVEHNGSVVNFSFPYTERITVTFRDQVVEYATILKLFKSMDLSGNKLSGEIPGELGSLLGLKNLNLSGNYLTGFIPRSLGNLLQLESLDLSRNNLSDGIPRSLSRLTFLSKFNVSCNNLSGRIPSMGQFHTFPNSSYTDNPMLCGKPLEVCEVNEVEHSESKKQSGQWLLMVLSWHGARIRCGILDILGYITTQKKLEVWLFSISR